MEEKRPRVGVGVFLIENNTILLGLRNPQKIVPNGELHEQGTWGIPGGKVDFGETLVDAAKRELLEETGILVENLEFLNIQDNIELDSHYVSVIFLATKWRGIPIVKEPDKMMEWKWFSLDHLPENMYSPSLKGIQLLKKKKVYEVK